ncbi:lysis system i-spanin subunit Rz [Yersinia enterocolitica]|uniref:lysis system i-spanin subunit Rz n=1 Tax=Yersinia enterocolitica TaxID=630 RepID=UPI003D069286
MKDYSAMSDFEINKAVAIHLGMKPFDEETGWQGLTKEPYVDVVVRGAGRLWWTKRNQNNRGYRFIKPVENAQAVDIRGLSFLTSTRLLESTLQLNATCTKPVSKTTGPASVPDDASARLTNAAERDYLSLRERIGIATSQINGLQAYINNVCLK